MQIQKEGTRGEPFDITGEGWIADYADPFDFIDVLLNGKNIHDSNNNNVAYFNDPAYNKKMDAAAKLAGAARYTAYGNLDVDLMKNAAPWAPDPQLQRPHPGLEARGLLHVQPDLLGRPGGSLPEVVERD